MKTLNPEPYTLYPALRRRDAGVTLFELLISIAILAIISTVGLVSWLGYQNTAALDVAVRDTLNKLHEAQGNAIARRDGTGDSVPDTWGAHIMNEDPGKSWVELFAGDNYMSGTIVGRATFTSRVDLQSPGEGTWVDVVFQLRTGKAMFSGPVLLPCPVPMSAATDCTEIVVYNLNNSSLTRIIRVWEQGGIEAL